MVKTAAAHFSLGQQKIRRSTIIIDTNAHLCFPHVMNQMKKAIVGNERGASPMAAVYTTL